MMRAVLHAVLAAALLAAPASLLAGNDKTPPGDPCGSGPGQGTGNPCKGNNGNQGQNGNSGKDKVRYDNHPDAFTVSRPGNARGAFITQIGDQA